MACASGCALAQPGQNGTRDAAAQTLYAPPRDPAIEFLTPYGLSNFSQHYIDALSVFLAAEVLYQNGKYQEARTRLDALWARHATGHFTWGFLPRKPFGINLGTPPCYYGLRMLSDMVDWRLAGGDVVDAPLRNVRLTVLVVGASAGLEPRNVAEINAGTGIQVVHTVHPRIARRDHRVVQRSLQLFNAYVVAMTEGRLGVETNILSLPSTELAVHTQALPGGGYYAGPVDPAEVWQAVPQSVQDETDWWWLVYPSHVPEQYTDFENAEFITGGMGVAPAGGPFFIIDDRWLVRKPPHLGAGNYSEIERRVYLPQWLQHEFFHHLFRSYPQFGLEDASHQWFNRSTWPPDFVGNYEADYYHEALYRRLQDADPPLHVALRYATADAPWEQLGLSDVLQDYSRLPVQNDWHTGAIHEQPGGQLVWTNSANVTWKLYPDLANGVLATGPDCPYFSLASGKQFRIELERDENGDLTTVVRGFRFVGELYTRD